MEQAKGENWFFEEEHPRALATWEREDWRSVFDLQCPWFQPDAFPACFSKKEWFTITQLEKHKMLRVVRRAMQAGDCQQTQSVIKLYQVRFGSIVAATLLPEWEAAEGNTYQWRIRSSTTCAVMTWALEGRYVPRCDFWYRGELFDQNERMYRRSKRSYLDAAAKLNLVATVAKLGIPSCGKIAAYLDGAPCTMTERPDEDAMVYEMVRAGTMALERQFPGYGPFPLQMAVQNGRANSLCHLMMGTDAYFWKDRKMMLASTGIAIAIAAARRDALLIAYEATLASKLFSPRERFEQLAIRWMPAVFVKEGTKEGSWEPSELDEEKEEASFRWKCSKVFVKGRLKAAERMLAAYKRCSEVLLPLHMYSPKARCLYRFYVRLGMSDKYKTLQSGDAWMQLILPRVLIDVGVVPELAACYYPQIRFDGALPIWERIVSASAGYRGRVWERASFPEPSTASDPVRPAEKLPGLYEEYLRWDDWIDEEQTPTPVRSTMTEWGIEVTHRPDWYP